MAQEGDTEQPQEVTNRKVRPVITPDAFSGKPMESWDDWLARKCIWGNYWPYLAICCFLRLLCISFLGHQDNIMLAHNVIQPSRSPWASPIVIVRKKDGSARFCVDYRKLNAITRKDAYPLPRIDDTLDTLSGSQWFSTLDLLSGYWQVEVAEGDRDKTAFATQSGFCEFKVMPFGLCNAPATFQRLMDLVLAGVQWSHCQVYMDDIIVVGS